MTLTPLQWPFYLNSFSNEDIICWYDDDKGWIEQVNRRRLALPSSPSQSNFRVYCIMIVYIKDENDQYKFITIDGTNGEPAYIGGSICAERSAILKLRHLENPIIKKVIITTDSENTISPGMLCREYLSAVSQLDTMIVLGNHDGTQIVSFPLKELYPYPYVYRYYKRNEIMEKAALFGRDALSIQQNSNDDIQNVFLSAMRRNKNDKLDHLHPIRFSAAVMLNNNEIKVAWQLKGLEYGCTIDPITQLVHDMEIFYESLQPDVADSTFEPANKDIAKYLIMVDQFGVAHAPFAQARALLTEHGHGNVKIIVHDEFGKLHTVSANDLVPYASTLLSNSDFH